MIYDESVYGAAAASTCKMLVLPLLMTFGLYKHKKCEIFLVLLAHRLDTFALFFVTPHMNIYMQSGYQQLLLLGFFTW